MSIKPILFNTEMTKAILDGRKTVTRRLPGKRIQEKWWEYDEWASDACAGFARDGIPCTRTYEKEFYEHYPPYQPGDILYVRETWRPTKGRMHTVDLKTGKIMQSSEDHHGYEYKAHVVGKGNPYYFPDGFEESKDYEHLTEITFSGKWHPSLHMPKEAARIWLKVTDVRLEKLREVTEEQATKEGAIDNRGFIHSPGNEYDEIHTAREHFEKIWNSTIKKQDLNTYGWDANPWVFVIEFERFEKPTEV